MLPDKNKKNLFGDTVDFTSPLSYLGQDCMQSHVIDICPFKVLYFHSHCSLKPQKVTVSELAQTDSERLTRGCGEFRHKGLGGMSMEGLLQSLPLPTPNFDFWLPPPPPPKKKKKKSTNVEKSAKSRSLNCNVSTLVMS